MSILETKSTAGWISCSHIFCQLTARHYNVVYRGVVSTTRSEAWGATACKSCGEPLKPYLGNMFVFIVLEGRLVSVFSSVNRAVRAVVRFHSAVWNQIHESCTFGVVSHCRKPFSCTLSMRVVGGASMSLLLWGCNLAWNISPLSVWDQPRVYLKPS